MDAIPRVRWGIASNFNYAMHEINPSGARRRLVPHTDRTSRLLHHYILVPKLCLGTFSLETLFRVSTLARNRVSQTSVPKRSLGTRITGVLDFRTHFEDSWRATQLTTNLEMLLQF
jgi:hypothetical protein